MKYSEILQELSVLSCSDLSWGRKVSHLLWDCCLLASFVKVIPDKFLILCTHCGDLSWKFDCFLLLIDQLIVCVRNSKLACN